MSDQSIETELALLRRDVEQLQIEQKRVGDSVSELVDAWKAAGQLVKLAKVASVIAGAALALLALTKLKVGGQ